MHWNADSLCYIIPLWLLDSKSDQLILISLHLRLLHNPLHVLILQIRFRSVCVTWWQINCCFWLCLFLLLLVKSLAEVLKQFGVFWLLSCLLFEDWRFHCFLKLLLGAQLERFTWILNQKSVLSVEHLFSMLIVKTEVVLQLKSCSLGEFRLLLGLLLLFSNV